MEPIVPLTTVKIASAFFGGLLSFFSPCVFPLIPSFAGVLFLGDMKKRRKIFSRILGFFAGLSVLFTFMRALSGLLGMVLINYRVIIRYVSGSLLLILALLFFLDLKLVKSWHVNLWKYGKEGFLPGLLLGGAVGSVWIPCASPILGAILVPAANTGTAIKGSFLLFIYSLGISIPFLLLGGTIGGILSKKLSFGSPRLEKALKYPGISLLVFMETLTIAGKL